MMRRRELLSLFSPLVLVGCMSMQPAANVADLRGDIPSQTMAEDAASQLGKVFPPAKTQLYFARPADDAFGHALAANLRGQGYAVEEAAGGRAGMPSSHGGLPVAYVVGPMIGGAGYRLSITVGNGVLSRAYLADQDGSVHGGAWAYRE